MGIDTYFYTIYGVKTEWDDKFNEDHDYLYDDHDTPWVLMDGMGGEYFIFGKPLFQSGSLRWGFEEGDFYKELDLQSLTELEVKYREEFGKKFPNHVHLLGSEPFKLISLIHFS
jgi:hypothetical protein